MVLSGNVMAEEVYYCSDDYATGFARQGGPHEPVNFRPGKFKMKFIDIVNGNVESIAITDSVSQELGHFVCKSPMVSDPIYKKFKMCADVGSFGEYFNFNIDNGRYVFMKAAGYVAHTGIVSTHIGTCTKF